MSSSSFDFSSLGDISLGRETLGESVPVFIYRMFQYSLREVLEKNFGVEKTKELLRDAGRISGVEFCRKMLNNALRLPDFIKELQSTFEKFKIAKMEPESMAEDFSEAVFVMAEDIDCSGMPVTGKVVCNFDEGFLEGIFNEYTGLTFEAREVDCWSNGGTICRFMLKRVYPFDK